MSKKQNKDDLNIDVNLIDKKVHEIGNVIEGLRLPEIMSILGTVIIEVEYNAAVQKVDATPVLIQWLEQIGTEVCNARRELFEEKNESQLN